MRLLKTPSVLPGFNISLGITVLCLSLLVVLPFAMMAVTAAGMGFSSFWQTIAEPRVLAALRISFGTALAAAAFNAVIVTFVFSVYLTDSVGADLDGPLSAATWLSISVAAAGLIIAVVALVYTAIITAIIGFALAKTMGWRISEDDEISGIDTAEHAESAYDLVGFGSGNRIGQSRPEKDARHHNETQKAGAQA